MSDIQIIRFDGDYNDEDTYCRVLGYIAQKKYVGGFGFSCVPNLPVAEWFRLSEIHSSYSNPEKIHHFVITFRKEWSSQSLISMAIWICYMFHEKYQSLWGADYSQGTPHLHFGINAFSYHPDIPPLRKAELDDFLKNLQKTIQQHYPDKTVTLISKKRKNC